MLAILLNRLAVCCTEAGGGIGELLTRNHRKHTGQNHHRPLTWTRHLIVRRLSKAGTNRDVNVLQAGKHSADTLRVMLAISINLNCAIITGLASILITGAQSATDTHVVGKINHESAGSARNLRGAVGGPIIDDHQVDLRHHAEKFFNRPTNHLFLIPRRHDDECSRSLRKYLRVHAVLIPSCFRVCVCRHTPRAYQIPSYQYRWYRFKG